MIGNEPTRVFRSTPLSGDDVDFFNAHIRPELRMVRRETKRLIPVAELERWAAENAERVLG